MLRWLLLAALVWPLALGAEPLHLSLDGPGERVGRPSFESSHRPMRMRQYWLHGDAGQTEAWVLWAHGQKEKLPIEKVAGIASVRFETGFRGGPKHGVNQVYVLSKKETGGRLLVETAQWYNVNHSCGWGHPFRTEPEAVAPQVAPIEGLQLVVEQLWDGNLHKATEAGQWLDVRVLIQDQPAAGALVRLKTGSGWIKEVRADEKGRAKVQLISDYFPGDWSRFKAHHHSRLLLSAQWEASPEDPLYRASLPWHFDPARSDYQRYEAGALIGFGGFLVSGLGVFLWRRKRRRW